MFAQKKLEYRPVSVKELLIEMKDTAMLMVDLAYATLIFKDKTLADEVVRLEQEIDKLIQHLQINIMLSARDVEDAQALQSLLQVALTTDRISNAAGDIVYPVLRGSEPHPILLEGIKKLDEPIVAVQVAPKSVLARKHMNRKLLRTKLGVDVLAVRRADKWMIAPEEHIPFHVNDTLIARGGTTGVEKLKEISAAGGTPT
ncbi:MAG: potassium channel family protein [Candidatus Bathyarchaeia archaeon]